MNESLRLLVIGAHPDDAEYRAGGLATLYRRLGHQVRFVSVTNGDAGHHETTGPALAQRRRREAEAATAIVGLEYEIWEHTDGRLEPTLPRREQMIRLIRSYHPDLVLTHRPNDYHPDHRATSQLVQDSAYLLTVPAICPDVPHLRRDPVIAYLADDFTRPYPFDPTVVIDVGPVWNEKVAMLDAHRSQFYEWLPYNGGYAEGVPCDPEARRAWLSERLEALSARMSERFRGCPTTLVGPTGEPWPRLVEAFEASEYGAPFDDAAAARLFRFAEGRRRDAAGAGR